MKKLFILLLLVNILSSSWANDIQPLPSVPCPDDGIKVRPKICCKGGYAALLKNSDGKFEFGEYTDVYGECGCPDGGVQSENDSGVCCKDGFQYVNYRKEIEKWTKTHKIALS